MTTLLEKRIKENELEIGRLKREIREMTHQISKVNTSSGIEKWRGYVFESSTELTREFAIFEKEFKKHIKKILPEGYEVVNWSRGHFEISGFIKKAERFIYFSVSDVRHWQDDWYDNILIRTAKHERDYAGGSNHYTTLDKFTENIKSLMEV